VQLSYEVHFFRADGTLGLRVFAAATSDTGAHFVVRRMRCAEFSSMKVYRGVNRAKAARRDLRQNDRSDPSTAANTNSPDGVNAERKLVLLTIEGNPTAHDRPIERAASAVAGRASASVLPEAASANERR
jgi:hypothetical protein